MENPDDVRDSWEVEEHLPASQLASGRVVVTEIPLTPFHDQELHDIPDEVRDNWEVEEHLPASRLVTGRAVVRNSVTSRKRTKKTETIP